MCCKCISPSGPGQPKEAKAQLSGLGMQLQVLRTSPLLLAQGPGPSPSHAQQLSNEDLIGFQEKRMHWTVAMETAPPTTFTIQRLLWAFVYNKLVKGDFQTCRPGFQCSLKVLGGMKNACGFCWEITRNRIVLDSSFGGGLIC